MYRYYCMVVQCRSTCTTVWCVRNGRFSYSTVVPVLASCQQITPKMAENGLVPPICTAIYFLYPRLRKTSAEVVNSILRRDCHLAVCGEVGHPHGETPGHGPPTWRNARPPPRSHVLVHVRGLKHVICDLGGGPSREIG